MDTNNSNKVEINTTVAYNGETGHVFTGKNASLQAGPWFTFAAIKRLGGKIRRGEHHSDVIVFYPKEKPEDKKDETEETEKNVDLGHTKYMFWHFTQIDGLDASKIVAPKVKEQPKEEPKKDEKKPAPAPKKDKTAIKGQRFDVIKYCVKHNTPVFLTGPAGCGKSFTCEQVAEALGLDFYYTNCALTKFDLVGFKDAAGVFHGTPFFNAYTKGGLFDLEEVDGSDPSALITLNNAIANGLMEFGGEIYHRHPDFRVVATGNTVGRGANDQYTGRQCLDISTLDRFFLYECDYEEPVQKAMLGVELSDFLNEVRAAYKKIGSNEPISYRRGQQIKDLEGGFLPLPVIIRGSIFKGVDDDTIQQIKEAMKGSTNKYAKALQAA